jgi:hypothetical protein
MRTVPWPGSDRMFRNVLRIGMHSNALGFWLAAMLVCIFLANCRYKPKTGMGHPTSGVDSHMPIASCFPLPGHILTP